MTAATLCRACGTAALAESARFCHVCGAPMLLSTTPAEYKQVTVLFADVVHSMELASAVGAERLREITRLRRQKSPISVAAIARHAGVSRTFVYTNPDAKTAVANAIRETVDQRRRLLADTDDSREATWRERALNAEDALKAAHAEILAQRARIGEILGRIRDLEAEWTQDAVQRITTENATLKQRVRQLCIDNRTLDERLKAARSNLRFQDRRIADLEVWLTESANPTELIGTFPSDTSVAVGA